MAGVAKAALCRDFISSRRCEMLACRATCATVNRVPSPARMKASALAMCGSAMHEMSVERRASRAAMTATGLGSPLSHALSRLPSCP
ncbi:MAG TPA: hypothetical protein P5026_06940 [Kiritimatiellia bacterium]|nr:hypothetical protein [Kiritimatiellia bacterium]HRU70807.1 hypothetical protein [Kiritimatiellia bacterium]